jgi:hypothetical protein
MSLPAHTNRPQSAKRRLTRRDLAWWSAAVVLLGLVASIGCDPIQTASFFLYPSNPNNVDPKLCSLTIEGKESKVLILAAHDDLVPNLQFRDAHRELSRKLSQLLENRFKENSENVKIVSVSKVLNYMDNHPNWITESKRDLGKRFGADFVVFLGLGPITMFEKGSHETLYRGDVEIQISVYDMHQAEGEELIKEDVYKSTYPSTGPEDAGGVSPMMFRLRFIDRVAKDLVQYLASHPSRDKVDSD